MSHSSTKRDQGESMSHDPSQFYGLDPEYSREASRGMAASADDLRSMVGDISAPLGEVLWIGPAAQRFKQDRVGSPRPGPQAATDALTANARAEDRPARLHGE